MDLGGTSWHRGCCPWCVVPLPMEINLGGLGVHPVPPGLSGAAGALAGDETERLCHVQAFLDFCHLLCNHRGARTSQDFRAGSVSSDLAGAMLPFVCSLGQEAMGKGFDRRQKQTIALLQIYDEWDVIGFFCEDIDLTL